MALDAVAILDRLVGFDTVSAKSNLALIEWVADYLDGYGIASALTRSPDGGGLAKRAGSTDTVLGGDLGTTLGSRSNKLTTAAQLSFTIGCWFSK